jgi:uncharacterized Zn finger protein (UPF0148 family)
MTKQPFLSLRRFRITKGGKAVYDQQFHNGINIIHGENGSGKSTVADAMFYALGGHFEGWKTEAAHCDEVQAEIETLGGVMTLRRPIGAVQGPISVYFGPMAVAENSGLDGWSAYPLKRSDSKDSFSQIMFRSIGIPEAQSDGASNVTMHQLLRLLYSDQRTPAAFLFRYESFDTREIREAVGDLICGIAGYEQLENELRLRELRKDAADRRRRLGSLLQALTSSDAILTLASIDSNISDLNAEYALVKAQISSAEREIAAPEISAFMKQRADAAGKVRRLHQKVSTTEDKIKRDQLDKRELIDFIAYLEELLGKAEKADAVAEVVGGIEFSHCPACLNALMPTKGEHLCVVCGNAIDPEREKSRYLQIRLDLALQLKESKQLLSERDKEIDNDEAAAREARRLYREASSEYSVRFELAATPLESYVAERYQRLGQIDREISRYEELRAIASELDDLRAALAVVDRDIETLEARQKALEASSRKRRSQALTAVSDSAVLMLKADLPRQKEFQLAKNVVLNFGDNSILVDGQLNFAESSNVVAKNSAVFALLLAALGDDQFFHPRFLLLDNIEDKGMEEERSHNFQRKIVEMSKASKVEHQIIFTTSKLAPELNKKEFVVGDRYTNTNRTLKF